MQTQALKQLALAKIESVYNIAEAHYGRTFTRTPVNFSNQLVKTAGYATYRSTYGATHTPVEIKLSTKIMELNPEEFIGRTPGHEAAHLIAVELYGAAGEGHGHRWKEVMHVIGQSAERYHQMEVPKGNTYTYVDTLGNTHEMTARQHNAMQKRYATYGARSTGAKITRDGWKRQARPQLAVAASKSAPTTVGKPKRKGTKKAAIRAVIDAWKAQGITMEMVYDDLETYAKEIEAVTDWALSKIRPTIRNHWDVSPK